VNAAEPLEPDELDPSPDGEPKPSRARVALFKRLADVVCLPESRVNAFERSMTADLLVDLLREAPLEDRIRTSRRLCSVGEIPANLARLLLRDHIDVAGPLLEESTTLSDLDLVDCARMGTPEHRRLIAARRGLSEVVSEAVVEPMDPAAVEVLLRNEQARFSNSTIEIIVAASRATPRFVPLVLRRAELRPHHAYIMFWWADADARRQILQRFAVSREVLQEAAADAFALAVEEDWSDPITRKAIEFIGPRQRNRVFLPQSRFDSLEQAIHTAREGMVRELLDEISYLAGLKGMTGVRILTDPGGEPLAILCKAVGLPKSAVRALWRAMRRPDIDASGGPSAALERVLITYDSVATDRARTVLRYWNWSLSSALTPALLKAIRAGDEDAFDDDQALFHAGLEPHRDLPR
jgi:uncharacterized protein (DUF2336 family)